MIAVGCGRVGFTPLAAQGGADGAAGDGAISFGDGITTTMRIMFVTSTRQNAGELAMLAGADQVCDDRAFAAQLPGRYVAWLSNATTHARDRITTSKGWVRTDGRVFADSLAALLAGQLQNPPAFDENGNGDTVSGIPVTTATDATGGFIGSDCNDWQSTGGFAMTGDSISTNASWTTTGMTFDCGVRSRLYCFGVD